MAAYNRSYGADREDEQFLSRMSPTGTWSAPVHHPGSLAVGQRSFDVDGGGRALIAWWDGTDLLGRWSQPAGRWGRPCVLAADVSKPRRSELDTQVVMNRRGDALVVWRATGRVGELWARYKPVGDGWTRPFKVTPSTSPPRASFTAAIGDRGHVAVAWTTRNNRQLQVRRVSLAP